VAPPGFAIELARSRMQPAWLSRTVTLGEMYEPDEAVVAGLLDRVVEPDQVEATVAALSKTLRGLHVPSHSLAKQRLRRATVLAMREAIDRELTPAAFSAGAGRRSTVVLPGA